MTRCIIVACLVLLISGSGCDTPQPDTAIQSLEGSGTRVYEVFGMDCPGCHGGLEKLVKKIPAVKDAQANWEKQQLAVIVRPGTELNDEDIYDAIERANFTSGERLQ